jgi:hypothetical protein
MNFVAGVLICVGGVTLFLSGLMLVCIIISYVEYVQSEENLWRRRK